VWGYREKKINALNFENSQTFLLKYGYINHKVLPKLENRFFEEQEIHEAHPNCKE